MNVGKLFESDYDAPTASFYRVSKQIYVTTKTVRYVGITAVY